MSGYQRGMAPVRPGDMTGRLFKQQAADQRRAQREGDLIDQVVDLMDRLSPAGREAVYEAYLTEWRVA